MQHYDFAAKFHALYDLAVARSMAGSFWSWFEESAAEFGCLAG